jgi:2'-5' RNA ligase
MTGIYDTLWNDAISAFERGEPQIDPHLSDKTKDPRRGVTLVFRPSPDVREAITAFIGRLATVCPGQYFYQPEELHLTVLSVFSGTEHWRRDIGRVAAGRRIIADVLKAAPPFKIDFHGITASPGTVMIQGFPADDSLSSIRDHLRESFARNGLGDLLDRRYKITGAHMTIMRFCRPSSDLKPLISFLKGNRETAFGESEVSRLQLIFNDWYASADTVRTLQEYRLGRKISP